MVTTLEAEATLTSQNQISVPAAIRQAMKLQAGKSRVIFRLLSDGTVVFSRMPVKAKRSEDPALQPFLSLLEKDIKEHPKRIKPFPGELASRAKALVKGVEVDLDGPLSGQD